MCSSTIVVRRKQTASGKNGMPTETRVSIAYCRAAWMVWIMLAAVMSVAVVVSIERRAERSVTPAYQSAVDNWIASRPLYNLQGKGFLYLPQAALTFAPWALLPHTVSELTWRYFILAVLAVSVARFNRCLGGDGRWFFVMTMSSALLAIGCARNGQSTLVITGLMILAALDLSESRWWRATFFLSLAFAFKPLAIVLALLAAVVYPQMAWRLIIGMMLIAMAPFLTQSPSYVLSQYGDCLQSLQVSFNVGDTEKWAQLFSMLEVAGLNLPSSARTLLRVSAAVATLMICMKAVRNLSPTRGALYLYSLSACYIMLFNSRTEGSTYAMVGPVYGVLLVESLFRWNNPAGVSWMIAAIVCTVLNYDIARLFGPKENAVWVAPLICVVVSGYLIRQLLGEIQQQTARNLETQHDAGADSSMRAITRSAA
jgi:hypothetical protein